MTNREYIIEMIEEVLAKSDDEELADIFTEIIGFPMACKLCLHDDEDENAKCNCTHYISKWLQSENTSKQYSW